MTESMRAPGVGSGPSFNRPENVYVIIVRDPRVDHVMSSASQAMARGEVSFAGQGAEAQQVVFDAR